MVDSFLPIDISVYFPGGKQIHATSRNLAADKECPDWKQDTYLYQDGDEFYLEQMTPVGDSIIFLTPEELREFVDKVLPLLPPSKGDVKEQQET